MECLHPLPRSATESKCCTTVSTIYDRFPNKIINVFHLPAESLLFGRIQVRRLSGSDPLGQRPDLQRRHWLCQITVLQTDPGELGAERASGLLVHSVI